MSIILLDNYDSFTYNLYQMIQAQTPEPVSVYRNDALDFEALKALQPSRIVLSPGPGHPAIAKDFGVCREVIVRAAELLKPDGKPVPVLGVCLGHQGMACHLGGQVVSAPQIVHGKTSQVKIVAPSPLLQGLSNPFQAMRYHSLVVERATLPETFEILAEVEDCQPENRLIMAMRHKALPLYGVQFHPESIGTPEGERLLGNFLSSGIF